MRYVVTYRKAGQIEGARFFDVQGEPLPETILQCAQEVAGPNATIVSIRRNDGEDIEEPEAA